MLNSLFGSIFQAAIFLALAPLLGGIIRKVKAMTQKRKGAPVLQMYRDLSKLMRKSVVLSDQSTWITRVTPAIVFGSTLCAALFIPLASALPGLGFAGDLIAVVYLLALSRFFMALGGLDAASTFGGMGSSREMMISALFEPAFLMTLVNLALFGHALSMKAIFFRSFSLGEPVIVLSILVLFLVLLAETARIPIDDPSTHLELTMVHEAMLLEYTGPHLALMEWAAALKQLVLVALLVRLIFPELPTDGILMVPGLFLFAAEALVVAFVVAVAETFTVKLRLFTVPNLAALSFILSLVAFLQQFSIGRV